MPVYITKTLCLEKLFIKTWQEYQEALSISPLTLQNEFRVYTEIILKDIKIPKDKRLC